jgi:2,4-dienoyl-CoA reductase-like NADH-dependent reductase (Old Yellow Enzyme family)
VGPGWPTPHALTREELGDVREAFVTATRRALVAGFDVVEVHAAHGYLLNQFLSPLTNRRDDEYGGSPEARMRFPLEVVEAVRAAWPEDKPLFVRVSSVDGSLDGVTVEDTVAFARELKARGVDMVDTSGGGLGDGWQHPIGYGYQVPFAQRVRAEADIPTMAVGLIVDARQAEAIIASGAADLVAIAREAQDDPNFAVHAARDLTDSYDAYPVQAGPRLASRDRLLGRLGPWTGPNPVQVVEQSS